MCGDMHCPDVEYLAGLRPERLDLYDAYAESGRSIFFLMDSFFAVSITPDVVSSRSSHTPCVGSLFFAVLLMPGGVSSQSSHTPCVGSLFVLGVGGRSAG